MAETSLKPCPFCGGEAELERDNDHHGEWFNLGCARNWHRVGPDQACPGGYIWYTAGPEEEAEAIAAWNRRATDPAVAAVEFVKQDFGGATVATILETDDSVVEVMERNDGTYELIVHARRSEYGPREDLSARLKPEHFELLGSIAKRMRATQQQEKDHG